MEGIKDAIEIGYSICLSISENRTKPMLDEYQRILDLKEDELEEYILRANEDNESLLAVFELMEE